MTDGTEYNRFLKSIADDRALYRFTTLVAVAVQQGDSALVVRARLMLHSDEHLAKPRRFECSHANAFRIELSDLNVSVSSFLENCRSGTVASPIGPLFLPFDGQEPRIDFLFGFPSDRVRAERTDVLRLVGAQRDKLVLGADFEWALRAASPPYDGLQDLLNEFGLGEQSGACMVEVVKGAVVRASVTPPPQPNQRGVVITAPAAADQSQITLGYKVISASGITLQRDTLTSTGLNWSVSDHAMEGTTGINVPPGGRLICYANYRQINQHFSVISESPDVGNQRLAAFQICDPTLKTFKEFLAASSTFGSDTRGLEIAVSWLAWMLGFQSCFVGADRKRLQDNPDLLFATPEGSLLVVECTTDLLKAEKLEKLIFRTERIREAVLSVNQFHSTITPVIISTLSRSELGEGLERARRSGIAVLANEDLNRWQVAAETAVNTETFFKEEILEPLAGDIWPIDRF